MSRGFFTSLRFAYSEILFDIKNDTNTSNFASITDLDIKNFDTKESCNYHPTNPHLLDKAFNYLLKNYNLNKLGLIDFGSGEGRVLIYASDFQFKKIVGVEFSKQLYEKSIDNLEKVNHSNISVFYDDATKFNLDDNLNIFFFFSPFYGSVMERVLKNIEQSYLSNQREIIIIYVNPICKDQILANKNYHVVFETASGEMLIFGRKTSVL